MDAQEAVGTDSTGMGSLIGAYAEELSGRANALAQQNLSLKGCGLCGDATLARAGDEVTVSAHRAPGLMKVAYVVTLLSFVFALIAAVLLMLPLMPWASPSITYESDAAALRTAGIVAIALLALNRAIVSFAGHGAPENIRMKRSDLKVTRSGRSYVLTGPLGRSGKRAIMVLRPDAKADKEILARVLS